MNLSNYITLYSNFIKEKNIKVSKLNIENYKSFFSPYDIELNKQK